MEDATLFLVVLAVDDAARRRRLRRILATFGQAVNDDAYEVPATPRGMVRLQRALEPELVEGDTVRIYPVCARCRDRAVSHGTDGFATVPLAWIF